MRYRRYAIYHLPTGPLAHFGAGWLGYDILTGTRVAHPADTGFDVAALTETPRRYGLHATIKPPFHLSEDQVPDLLCLAFEELCRLLPAVRLNALELVPLGRFLALADRSDDSGLTGIAASVVRDLDRFRAPMQLDELAQRNRPGLSAAQVANLQRWGYPHVMDQFRFHITLTGRLRKELIDPVANFLRGALADCLNAAYQIEHLSLVGETADGLFHEIQRVSLTAPDVIERCAPNA